MRCGAVDPETTRTCHSVNTSGHILLPIYIWQLYPICAQECQRTTIGLSFILNKFETTKWLSHYYSGDMFQSAIKYHILVLEIYCRWWQGNWKRSPESDAWEACKYYGQLDGLHKAKTCTVEVEERRSCPSLLSLLSLSLSLSLGCVWVYATRSWQLLHFLDSWYK